MIKILTEKDLEEFLLPVEYCKIDRNNLIEKITYALRCNEDIKHKFNITDRLYSKYYWLCKYNELFYIKHQHYDYEIEEEISDVIRTIDIKDILNIELLESLERKAITEVHQETEPV